MVGDISVPPTLATQGGSSWDMSSMIDGIIVTTLHSTSYQVYNDAMIQESTYQSSALPAETSRGGVRVNLIGRDGGNKLAGGMTSSRSEGNWQANNVTPELLAKKLREANRMYHAYDFDPWLSGPIKRDRLWLFASYRSQEYGSLAASTAQGGGYGPIGGHIRNATARVSWQAAPKHKITIHLDETGRHNPVGAIGDPATGYRPDSMYWGPAVAKWSSPMTNRLLFEIGYAWNAMGYTKRYLEPATENFHYRGPTRGTPEWYAFAGRIDLTTGIASVASNAGVGAFLPTMHTISASTSYVTGSHTLKVGTQFLHGKVRDEAEWAADLLQIYQNSVPVFVDILNSPTISRDSLDADLGLYAQDSWTLKRLTVNAGARYEYFDASIEATSSPAGRFMPARSFPAVKHLPQFKDVNPRFGVAYDLFGDGRTAIKASVSRYVVGLGLGNPGGTRNYDPTAPIASSAGAAPTPDRRDWTDRDRSGLDLPTNGDNIAQENEIGPSNNLDYGLKAPRRLDPNVRRPNSIEYATSVQHEIVPGISATLFVAYRPYGNVLATKNQAVAIDDYTAFQAPNPLNASEQITIYNLNRAKQGQSDLVDYTSHINKTTYTGFHLTVNARLPRGGTLVAGWSDERTAMVTCETNNPNERRFCDQNGKLFQEAGVTQKPPFRSSYKLLGTFPGLLPYDFTASAAIRAYQGDARTATWVVPASLFPGGRTQSVTVPLLAPNTEFLPTWTQVDLTLRKTIRMGRTTFSGDFTLFNVLNSNTIITENPSFGTSFRVPTSIISGRLPRVGFQVNF